MEKKKSLSRRKSKRLSLERSANPNGFALLLFLCSKIFLPPSFIKLRHSSRQPKETKSKRIASYFRLVFKTPFDNFNMRNLFLVFILSAIFAPALLAQTQQPLTQAEFVKNLYEIQKNPAKRDQLVEQVRTRGIGFEITSPLRSLVQSKSGDAVLIRTLEEAARRRSNPATASLPSEKEANELLTKAREATLASLDEMPDFVVKQLVARSYAYAKTNNFQSADKLTVAVSYSADKGEDYKVLAINGIPQAEEKGERNYMKVGGTTSAGEFVTVLASIFKPETRAEFRVVDTDVLRARRALVYEYSVKRSNSQQRITSVDLIPQSTISGYQGKIWIDRETARVLRVEQEATSTLR